MAGTTRQFFIDSVRQARISGTTDWQGESYTITGSGTHSLKWRYTKNGYGTGGSDCAWVDYVQSPSPTDWLTITYGYDSAGRRIEKAYDGQTVMKYLYDGDQIIAEYDGNGSLLHKYIYGPGVDQPICMIDVEHSNATYYYHFDGLGSVIALTNSSGSVVNLYEYSVFGEVSASDPNHPNRFLFIGREFDADTGLYYYRARYYNPYLGRFLQTDPAGQGVNQYSYCENAPTCLIDPLGQSDMPLVGGGFYPDYELQTVDISARRLVSWYFLGKGMGLWYNGGHAGQLVKDAIEGLVYSWLLNINTGVAIEYVTDDATRGELHTCIGGTAMSAGVSHPVVAYASTLTEVLFGPSDPAIKLLLNQGMVFIGKWGQSPIFLLTRGRTGL